ncbi:MAG: MFS transporter [Dehalococcoidales bacterium]|jgi:MFS family permease|nr:MFS transporter [Dehalococcoidales bacterium]MDP7285698.1 MFS transporter [Dehalococcoidales bacterium]MDP7415776.1 MFS transporter [Dehalococcoidales bacterium]
MVKQSAFFYGWVIVGISVAGMALIYGIRHSFAVFFPPVLDEFGWSRGSTALMLSLNILVYGFTAPVAGSLGDRWKPYRVMPIGVVFLGLATVGCAFARELWHFYLLFGFLMPVGTAFSGWPLLCPALANWFSKRRGMVMGIGQMGGGLSFVYGVFVEFVILQLGWRYAFFVVAGVLTAILLPLYFFFFHYRPEGKGLKAYGSDELPATGGLTPDVVIGRGSSISDWTLGQAVRTYQLWCLVATQSLFWGVGCYMVLPHQVQFTQDMGYSSTFAASIFALFGIFMMVGQISAAMSDWIGREKMMTLAVILSIGALVALVSVRDTSQPWLLYIYAILLGCGAGLVAPVVFAGAADLFHGRHYGVISGLMLTGFGIGGVIGPWLGGYIYDISGSYISAFILSMVCFGMAGITYWIAAPRKAVKLLARS